MRFEEVEITPEMAEEWLRSRAINRNTSVAAVDRYSEDMRAGRWLLTHQAIAFNEDGKIFDGQHRLISVMQAGVPVRMMVAYDVPNQVMGVVDSGLARRTHDLISIMEGRHIHPGDVSIARMMISIPHGKSPRLLTAQNVALFLRKHGPVISAVRHMFPYMRRGITRAAVYAPLARAMYTHNEQRIREFADVLFSGRVKNPETDNAALKIRDWLVAGMRGKTFAVDIETYARVEYALQAFLENRDIAQLRAAGKELFLLPEETEGQYAERREEE